jgi:hypothetical protein
MVSSKSRAFVRRFGGSQVTIGAGEVMSREQGRVCKY